MTDEELEYLRFVDERFMHLALTRYATPQEVCDLYGVDIEDFWAYQRKLWREDARRAHLEAVRRGP